MNTKFDKIYLEAATTIDSDTLKKRLGPLLGGLGTKEKEGLNAITGAIEDTTQTNPYDELIQKLEELDMDKMDTTSKEKFIKTLLSKNINLQKNETENQNKEQEKKPTQSSLTYSAPSFQ